MPRSLPMSRRMRIGNRSAARRPELAAEAWVATRPSTSLVVLSRLPRSGAECTTPRVGREKNAPEPAPRTDCAKGGVASPGAKWGPAPRKAPRELKTL